MLKLVVGALTFPHRYLAYLEEPKHAPPARISFYGSPKRRRRPRAA